MCHFTHAVCKLTTVTEDAENLKIAHSMQAGDHAEQKYDLNWFYESI